MDDVYVLNQNLQLIGIIDAYKSLIWANRYWTVGDCELYVVATTENLSILQKGNYLMRTNSEMVGATYEQELHRVIIHGVLHLCGINDKGEGEREIMEACENKALAMIAI